MAPSSASYRRVLGASMFVMGACGIIYEYVLGSLGNNIIGTSHEQIYVIIGLMMFAMGMGAKFQTRISGNLVDAFLALEITLGLVGGLSPILIYAAFAYTSLFQLVMYSLAFAIGAMIGLEIPLLIRINEEHAGSLKTNLSDILTMDYVGSLVGALLFAYVLLTRLSLFQISLSLGIVNSLIALGGLAWLWSLVGRARLLLGYALATLAVLCLGLAYGGQLMVTMEQRTYKDPIIYSRTTKYQHLVLTKWRDHLRLFINGNLQFSSRDEAIYHEKLAHMPGAVLQEPKRALILGGGDGLALREVLKYPSIEAVDLVDIDPAITDLAASHPALVALNGNAFADARVARLAAGGVREAVGVLPLAVERPAHAPHLFREPPAYETAQVSVFHLDADAFLREARGRYDLILIDFPDPTRLEVAKLYSVGFYRMVAGHLEEGGLMAVQSTSPYHARKVFLCIGETLRTAGYQTLPYHANVPSFGEWGFHLAWREGWTREEIYGALARLAALPVETTHATPATLLAACAFGKGWLESEGIRPNTRMRPTLIEYSRYSWQ